MTFVIAIQGLVGALAGLLLLESRVRREEEGCADYGDDDTMAPNEFHPELIVRWDDEANYARRPSCTRKLMANHAAAVRPQVMVSRSNTR